MVGRHNVRNVCVFNLNVLRDEYVIYFAVWIDRGEAEFFLAESISSILHSLIYRHKSFVIRRHIKVTHQYASLIREIFHHRRYSILLFIRIASLEVLP